MGEESKALFTSESVADVIYDELWDAIACVPEKEGTVVLMDADFELYSNLLSELESMFKTAGWDVKVEWDYTDRVKLVAQFVKGKPERVKK